MGPLKTKVWNPVKKDEDCSGFKRKHMWPLYPAATGMCMEVGSRAGEADQQAGLQGSDYDILPTWGGDWHW